MDTECIQKQTFHFITSFTRLTDKLAVYGKIWTLFHDLLGIPKGLKKTSVNGTVSLIPEVVNRSNGLIIRKKQTLPIATRPIVKTHPFRKISVTFQPIMQL